MGICARQVDDQTGFGLLKGLFQTFLQCRQIGLVIRAVIQGNVQIAFFFAMGKIVSPMYGKIVKINVREKQVVKKGDILLVIDSMKIENNILAPRDTVIGKLLVKTGEQVEVNKSLLLITSFLQSEGS